MIDVSSEKLLSFADAAKSSSGRSVPRNTGPRRGRGVCGVLTGNLPCGRSAIHA